MTAKYRISEEDYVNAMKLFARLTPRAMAVYLAAALVLALLALSESPVLRGGGIGGLAGGLIVTVVGRYIASPMLARRHYRKYRAIQDEFAVEVLADGVRFLTHDADATLTWRNVLKWRQNDQYVLIYPMPRMYHIIPKSVAGSGFDLPLLIERLTQHVGKPS